MVRSANNSRTLLLNIYAQYRTRVQARYTLTEGAKPLQVGNICRPEARIVSVTNSNEGKVVKVKGYCCRNNQAVIEAISLFLYHGHFVDYENTFDTTEEPDYLVLFETDADVGVL